MNKNKKKEEEEVVVGIAVVYSGKGVVWCNAESVH